MIRHSQFKFPYEYFHFNFKLEVFPLFKPLDWRFLCHCLNKCLEKWPGLEIQSLVMMDSHTHILFRLPGQGENFFTTELLGLLGQKKPQETLVEPIRNYSQYLNTYKYIYRNPVEAGLSLRCETYPYSSLHLHLGLGEQILKTVDAMNVIQHPNKILSWLNYENFYKQSKLKEIQQKYLM